MKVIKKTWEDRVLIDGSERIGAVNFIDENNVLLGYDLDPSCCERFGWSISKTIPKTWEELESLPDEPYDIDLDGWFFDPGFYAEHEFSEDEPQTIVAFRIVKGEEEQYIILFNSHNGYYSHGFELKRGDIVEREGHI